MCYYSSTVGFALLVVYYAVLFQIRVWCDDQMVVQIGYCAGWGVVLITQMKEKRQYNLRVLAWNPSLDTFSLRPKNYYLL